MKTLFTFSFPSRKQLILLVLVVLFVGGHPVRSFSQRGFTVDVCADSAAVVALFDTVFFSKMPPQTIRNLTFRGDPSAVGYFSQASFSEFEKTSGIILTTGKADDADKANQCNTDENASSFNAGVEGDPDLEQLAGVSSHNGCIIEFDFKPTADTVRFNYVFTSEEYHDYVFAMFNDMFGFFLSGNGISGPYSNDADNIALIPGTNTGVSINTVNFGKGGITCTGKPSGCTNCEWFKDNSQSSNPAFSQFVYDGLTKALPAGYALQSGKWYHIKLAISDGGDAVFDSALLLERESFFTGFVKARPGWHIID